MMSLKKSRLPRTAPGLHVQYGALPFRRDASGEVEILLITSRDTGRWVIPKGWPMKNRSPVDAARIEAHEEAGIMGRVAEEPIGKYRYVKWTPNRLLQCEVTVFLMVVEAELDDWPEMSERRRAWASPSVAAGRVEERDLAETIRSIPI